jgi:mono/diheme cytochrome c family protein
MKTAGTWLVLAWSLPVFLIGLGCRRDMFNQPKSNPLQESAFFPDGAASRPLPPHTVSRDDWDQESSFYTGRQGTNLITTFPFPVTRAVLDRGRERYDIYCAPCHGQTGDGKGIVVLRGLSAPPPLDLDRLRASPAGHFVEVITRGYGVMFPQSSQVAPADRWAIAAYIRALQLSQHGTLPDLSAAEQAKFKPRP